MTERVSMTVDGRPVAGAFARGAGPVGVVVLHEFWGLNRQVEGVADRWAARGFPALAADLYDGVVAATREEASRLMQALDRARAVRIVESAAAELRSRGARRVAVLGFCMGGSLALTAAERARGVDGAVVYYGIPDELDAARVRVPLLLHFANEDAWCTPARVDALERSLQAAGAGFSLHRYDAQHAFCNETRAGVYDAAKAALADERTASFLAALA
jgi:carboxymethylenebutenolidase